MIRHVTSGLVLGYLFFAANVLVGTETKSDPKEAEESICEPEAKSQLDLNACAFKKYQKADAELNRVYREILKKYKNDPVFIKKLRAAQRAWLKFRDAQFEATFPQVLDSHGQYTYGSIFPMCASLYKEELIKSRIKELRLWLDGVEEGELCSGSVPDKEY